MTNPSFRDVELISALLDEKLPREESARLQLRIAADPELVTIYQQLSQSRALLRKLPIRRAPRNFTLTPKMAGVKAPVPRSFPLFRFASAFASLLLVLTFAANGLGQLAANAPAAPAYGVGGGPMTEAIESAPAEPRPQSGGGSELEPPALAAPAAPEDAANAPTQEALRAQPEQEMPAAKATGEEVQALEVTDPPAQNAFQISGWLQLALLVIALLAGGAAWFVHWQANFQFARKNKK